MYGPEKPHFGSRAEAASAWIISITLRTTRAAIQLTCHVTHTCPTACHRHGTYNRHERVDHLNHSLSLRAPRWAHQDALHITERANSTHGLTQRILRCATVDGLPIQTAQMSGADVASHRSPNVRGCVMAAATWYSGPDVCALRAACMLSLWLPDSAPPLEQVGGLDEHSVVHAELRTRLDRTQHIRCTKSARLNAEALLSVQVGRSACADSINLAARTAQGGMHSVVCALAEPERAGVSHDGCPDGSARRSAPGDTHQDVCVCVRARACACAHVCLRIGALTSARVRHLGAIDLGHDFRTNRIAHIAQHLHAHLRALRHGPSSSHNRA